MIKKMFEQIGLIFKFKFLTRFLLARKKFYNNFGNSNEQKKIMVNLGGGLFFRPYWQVMDYISPYYPFAKRYVDHNIDLFSKPRFPFKDNSVNFFYSAHTLEHIPQEYCENIMTEFFRCLKPGGAVRINMPDYDRIRLAADTKDTNYFGNLVVKGLSFEEAVVEQIATSLVGVSAPEDIQNDYKKMTPIDFANHYSNRASREIQIKNGGHHINWFNFKKLGNMLREAGFNNFYKSSPQDSRFAELRGEGGILTTGDLLEVKRMLGMDTTYPDRSLYVEAKK